MPDIQVTCITKKDRTSAYEGITHLGGTGWRWTREQVIQFIEARVHTFHVSVGGSRNEIYVAQGPNGKQLRTHANGQVNDNLLSLPECR